MIIIKQNLPTFSKLKKLIGADYHTCDFKKTFNLL